MSAEEGLESNWDGATTEGKNSGPEARIAGETNMDDEFCMEEEDEEEAPVAAPTVWRMLARYYSLKVANFTLIHKHFTEVWRIRGKMIFKPLKDNFFIITFNREGDYKFVEQGGPWIHLGVACLIAPFVDSAQPSEAVLDTVRLWVRFYDVPWKKQTKEYGETLGSKFGKVVAVDVDAEGLELSEYLRVRIDWPLNQRFLARFKITKGQLTPKIYHMRYERVPYFCFHCGFIGHNEEQCERRIMGTPSLQYDATLRCSPKRKFQSRAVSTPDEPAAKKFLRFNSPEGSVNSSSLGIPPNAGRQVQADQGGLATDIPPAVDAHDGFEEQERRIGEEEEIALANTVNKLQLKLSKDKEARERDNAARGMDVLPGKHTLMQGGGSGKEEVTLAPNAMQIMQKMASITSDSHGTPSGPHSSDMIPPLRGLSQLGTPLSGSDVSMADAESILGKRMAGNGSSTWHAIEYGLELLKKGVIWRVGNGASIRAWRDPWIPRESNHKPQSPQGRCRYRWVGDFLLPDGSWNLQRLEQYFSDADVKEIMQIKPSRRNENDFVSWFPGKNGMFTVRSAYRLALHRDMMQHDRGATSYRPDGARPSSRLIWKCPVPPKVQTLAWKICRNAIATQVNMFRRGMATTEICQICGREEEDSLHTFLRCPHALALWRAMTEVWDLPNLETMRPEGHEWLLQILHAC
ncbi:hypothetical protein ACQ4PT_004493 [Festuca glaucescens]